MDSPLDVVVVTRFLKPSRTRGARLKSFTGKLQVEDAYDPGKSDYVNHLAAAKAHAARISPELKLVGDGRLPTGKDRVFIFSIPSE